MEINKNPSDKKAEEKEETSKIIENQPKEDTKKEEPIENIENMPLNSSWTFWYASRKEKDHHIPYSERLTKIAEFNTLQDFFKYYLYL